MDSDLKDPLGTSAATLLLPARASGRALANSLAIEYIGSLTDVQLDCSKMKSGNREFADQLVIILLLGAERSLVVHGPPKSFMVWLEETSEIYGVQDHLFLALSTKTTVSSSR